MLPALVQWELTPRCNYRCQHCYRLSNEAGQREKDELTNAEIHRIAKLLADHHLFFVTLTGGEPLLRSGLVLELIHFFQDRGIFVSLNTNLLLYRPCAFQDLRLHGMLISCPSSDPDRYCLITGMDKYEDFEKNLQHVIASGQHHTVNMVVNKLNFRDVQMTARRMSALGVRRFAATPVSLNSRFPRYDLLLDVEECRQVVEDLVWVYETLGMDVDIMEAMPKCIIPERAYKLRLPFIFRSCFAGRRNGTIAPNGDIRPCGHNPNTFGNLLQEPMESIWDRMQSWRETEHNDHRNCLSCDVFTNCGGGCAFGGHPKDPRQLIADRYLALSNMPGRRPPLITMEPGLIVRPARQLLVRREGEGWLVCSGSPRNMITVNQHLLTFLSETRDMPPSSLADLAQRFGSTFSDSAFQNIMEKLIMSAFFLVDHKWKKLE